MFWIRILLILAFSWILLLVIGGLGTSLLGVEVTIAFVVSLVVVLLIYIISLLNDIRERQDQLIQIHLKNEQRGALDEHVEERKDSNSER